MKYIIAMCVLVVCGGLLASGTLAQGMNSDKCQKCMSDQSKQKNMSDCMNKANGDQDKLNKCSKKYGCDKECGN